MNIEVLKEAGLTDGEAKVYIALIKLGSTTVGPILHETNVSNSIIYRILESLIEKGLVSYIIKEKTKYFKADEPVRLVEYLEERKQSIEKSKNAIEKIIPALLSMSKASETTEVRVYEGFHGIVTAFEHYYVKLKKGEEYVSWGIYPFQETKYHLYWQRDHKKRGKLGITCKLLFNQETEESILKNRNSYKGCDARHMPTDIKTPAWFMVYKNTSVIFLQTEKPVAVEIINQEIADSFMAYFIDLWNKTKKFK